MTWLLILVLTNLEQLALKASGLGVLVGSTPLGGTP